MTCMCRRHALMLIGCAVAMPLAGCFEPETGPVDIAWDRDSCELCRMLISDPKFAAQVRGGPSHKIHKFDDIGCAITWLNDKPWAGDPKTEIWVAEQNSTRAAMHWLDARKVRFIAGAMTPMNYGFAAVAGDAAAALTFEQVADRVLKGGPNHICHTPVGQAAG